MSNLDFLQSENDRREAEAQASAQEAFADSTQPGETIQPWRYGVAKIVANSGSGAYTITEQYLDSSGVWQACSVLGFVAATAYDFKLRTTGTAGDTVVFWQTSKQGGTDVYLIDVGAGLSASDIGWNTVTHYLMIDISEYTWPDLGTDPVQEISSLDMRNRILRVSGAESDAGDTTAVVWAQTRDSYHDGWTGAGNAMHAGSAWNGADDALAQFTLNNGDTLDVCISGASSAATGIAKGHLYWKWYGINAPNKPTADTHAKIVVSYTDQMATPDVTVTD